MAKIIELLIQRKIPSPDGGRYEGKICRVDVEGMKDRGDLALWEPVYSVLNEAVHDAIDELEREERKVTEERKDEEK